MLQNVADIETFRLVKILQLAQRNTGDLDTLEQYVIDISSQLFMKSGRN